MKKVLIATLAASAFIASSASFADDVDGASFEALNAVDQTASASSSFDGFKQIDTSDVLFEETIGNN
ncbi:MAG: hypothetical protein ABJL18_08325 [Hyphomicrobiales bacterium]